MQYSKLKTPSLLYLKLSKKKLSLFKLSRISSSISSLMNCALSMKSICRCKCSIRSSWSSTVAWLNYSSLFPSQTIQWLMNSSHFRQLMIALRHITLFVRIMSLSSEVEMLMTPNSVNISHHLDNFLRNTTNARYSQRR